ncbi:HU family DNA-binding protein [Dyadobacter psychrotolerans]|uniref:Integration host factor subunit beta n=1 Tax=Dyadobacter psychrotolerans TaxID=2541721 RepID=A0A4R5DAT0_9BACT|nr:HU family DNA-binding protein [Dyadobacter psychrotolerans]TDE10719.1 integration host factor subunit beta [Dyadobacter psychrotolerans]
MTKAETISRIADKTGIQIDEVEKILEAFFITVKNSVSQGDNIYVRGFGSFIVKQRAKKTARNISLNTTVIIPAHNIPFFKPSKEFTNQVKEGALV